MRAREPVNKELNRRGENMATVKNKQEIVALVQDDANTRRDHAPRAYGGITDKALA